MNFKYPEKSKSFITYLTNVIGEINIFSRVSNYPPNSQIIVKFYNLNDHPLMTMVKKCLAFFEFIFFITCFITKKVL